MLRFAIAALLTCSLVLACSSSAPPDNGDASMMMPPPTEDAGPCGPGGAMMCGNACVNIKRDHDNCGACGKACKEGEVCVQGGCALQCGGGTTKCNGACVDQKSDPTSCGNCGNKCSPGQVCSMGKCAATCQQGLSDCMSSCVDLQTDHDNCGACGNACPDGKICTGGACVATCQAGWSACSDGDGGTTCVDLTSDANNCGVCGKKCLDGYACSLPGPACKLNCLGGTTLCNMKCADTQLDPQNCGGCGNACANNNVCTNGHCCPKGQAYCSGSCKPALQCCNLVGKVNNQLFCKVAVSGTMSDANIRSACVAAGLNVGCQAQNCGQYSDNLCVPTQETSCGNPMYDLAKAIGCNSPSGCGALDGVYQYMGQKWINGSACGVEGFTWCSIGNNYSNRWGLCTP